MWTDGRPGRCRRPVRHLIQGISTISGYAGKMAETQQKQKLTLKALDSRLQEIEAWKTPTKWTVHLLEKGQAFCAKHVYDFISFKSAVLEYFGKLDGWAQTINAFHAACKTRLMGVEQAVSRLEQAKAPTRAEFEALQAELAALKLQLSRLDAAEQIDGAEPPPEANHKAALN